MRLHDPAAFGFRGTFSDTDEVRLAHAGSTGILRAVPAAVAIPRDPSDVSALLTWAAATRTPLVPRGAATGMPGGNVGPAVAVDMRENFRAPPIVDAGRRTARTAPGITLAELNRVAAGAGLHFPVDPSSGARCTLGGMIANNAAGAHSVRYGSTRHWVRGLEVVLADGTVVDLERGVAPPDAVANRLASLDSILAPHREHIRDRWPKIRKNSSGYALAEYLETADAIDLLVGSEGTLAFVTGALLDLTPIPTSVGLLLLEFDDLDAATRAVVNLLPLRPLTCEMLDRTFLDLVRRGGGDRSYPLREGIEALLLVEVADAGDAELSNRIDEARAAVSTLATRWTRAIEPREIDSLWEIRHAASPIIARSAGNRVSMQFIEDSVVPVDRLHDYVAGLRKVLATHELPAVIFGHAGDGNLHVNPLVDVANPAWRATIEAVLAEITELVISLGGTLAGEHGDGRLRAPLLEAVWGPEIVRCFAAVKSTFDPTGILNPGVILPLPGQRPFDMLQEYA